MMTTDTDYQELLYETGQRFADNGVPFHAQIELTKRCPLDCAHCYVDHKDPRPELTTEEIIGLLDDLAELGVFDLTLTGGEPLLRHDFWDILAHARARSFNLRLFTSGWRIDPEAARHLHELALGEVHISLYSADPGIHDGITGLPGSHAQSLRAIRALKSAGLRVYLKTVLMRRNLASFAALVELAEELGITYLADTNLLPAENGVRDPQALGLSEQELYAFFSDPAQKARLWRGDRYRNLADILSPERHTGRLCEIGRTAIFIGASGDVSPCAVYPFIGTIRTQRASEIWHSSPELARLRAFTHETQTHCPSCPWRDSCAPCPGAALLETQKDRGCNRGSRLHARALSRLR